MVSYPISSKGKQPAKPVAIRLAKTKATVSDSWDDDLSDDEEDNCVSRTGDNAVLDGQGLLQVLQAFKMLQVEFNKKHKAMWA
ncbi:hypothetical protein TSTA_075270 [Talaromyces stipitatus ATCC 10500]|uniref:Uncharacterized protein n=1 Tax=Talaromyces stipitatus (strain ATCC 10500 / CBS 375.48 / QM 6759 / NRRL 1006) TaxID=441959 RepID=B8LVM5_TALSN|nr:uncharacterized protein TSTA_075270 [Talaromyces stipitatus ATCC 10500]EED24155.1 hypothetical protein TSTA_075270 [Talaromyces stipitatus ATCC 10500]